MEIPKEIENELEKLTDFQRTEFWSNALKRLIGKEEYGNRTQQCLITEKQNGVRENGFANADFFT